MPVRYRTTALADIASIHHYIAQHNPAAARRVVTRIQRACQILEHFPRMGRPGEVDETFELVVTGTPYVAVYEMVGIDVEVVAVFHAARDRS